MQKNNYQLSDNFFLKFEGAKLILWDYINHQQFTLDESDISELTAFFFEKKEISRGFKQVLIDEKILVPSSNRSRDWGWDLLSYIFHMGTQNLNLELKPLEVEEYCEDYVARSNELIKTFNFAPLYTTSGIKLPKINESLFCQKKMFDILKKRKTTREFRDYCFNLDEFSSLLYATFGDYHGQDIELKEKGIPQIQSKKLSPSAGNIHPEEGFIYIENVESLPKGFYYYNNTDHSLHKISEQELTKEDYLNLFCNQFYSLNSSFLIFFVTRFDKIWWKYRHSRAYKHAYLEIGSVAQTMQLLITALERRFWQTGHFQDNQVSDYLNLTDSQCCTFILAVGEGDGNAIPSNFNSYI